MALLQMSFLKTLLRICHRMQLNSYAFTIFAELARHGGSQSARSHEMTFLPLPCSSLFPFDSRVPQLPPTARWAPFVTFIFLLQHLNGNREHLRLLPLTGTVTRLWLIR